MANSPRNLPHIITWLVLLLASCLPLKAQTFFVSPAGNDANPGTESSPWKTFQHAANAALPGSTVYFMSGVYNEKVVIGISGSAVDGMVSFQNYPGDTVIIDGTGKTGDQLILIEDKSYIRIMGLELRNNLNQSFGTGIWIRGTGTNIELLNNCIHDMRARPSGGDAMGISVYGSHPSIPLSNIIIDGNLIYDCEPGHSEALVLNGNVDTFRISNNIIHDVDNIGIDMIGGEGTCPTPALDAARNGVCSGNIVYNARSNYGGGYAAGIYVDGGRNILLERNIIHHCDVGMEIGCENAGRVASNITVRNSLIYSNDKAGLGFGGYDFPSTGKVTNSMFRNNTCFNNDVLGVGDGELWIQYAEQCTVLNNIFSSSSFNRLMTTTVGSGIVLDYNLWYTPAGNASASVDWNGKVYTGFNNYLNGTGQDGHSLFGNPLFVSSSVVSPDVHLQQLSPAINAGDPALTDFSSEKDLFGLIRLVDSRVDIGAVEQGPPSVPPPSIPMLAGVTRIDSAFTLRWKTTEAAVNYHVQLSTTAGFSAVEMEDSSLTDTMLIIQTPVDSSLYYWRVRALNDGGQSGWSEVWSFVPTEGNIQLNLQHKWNLLSLPADPLNSLVGGLFPSAISGAFAYEGGYAIQESLKHGKGYWIKFTGDQPARFTGAERLVDTISISHGWNLIGMIGVPIAAENVISQPPGLHLSQFFHYRNKYETADTLWPGSGYWVKSDTTGAIILSSTSMLHTLADRIRIHPILDEPPPPPSGRGGKADEIVLIAQREPRLEQNYPNPFNPVTEIRYQVAAVSEVSLKVYDVLGREVVTLLDELHRAGSYSIHWNAGHWPSGVYFYRLKTGSSVLVRKMLLMK